VNSDEDNEYDWEMNAMVGKADSYAYSEGYRLAGRIVADHAIQNALDVDFLVYPVIFLYRHYVELQLKRLIPTGARLVGQELSEANRKLLQQSHRLNQLWALFEPILQKARQENMLITPEEIGGLGWYVLQLNEIDPKSEGFRYQVTRSGEPSINNNQHPALNIGVIAEGMEKLTGYLFGLGEAFDEALEVKSQMENEASGYHDGE
jgi:hypothetical protein